MSDSHSLAFMTGTRVDSAAKHIMACKIDSHVMKAYAGTSGATLQDLHHAKLDFITEKDDLIVNTCQKIFRKNEGALHAYPPVISHLGKASKHLHFFLKWLYSLTGAHMYDFLGNLHLTQGDVVTKVIAGYNTYRTINRTTMLQHEIDDEINAIGNISDDKRKIFNAELQESAMFQIQGYALGRAFASSISGDTVFSVLIGGCATVINGHFPMYTGQLVQWYFGFEHALFHLDTVSHPGQASNVAGSRRMNQQGMDYSKNPATYKRRRLEEPKREQQGFIFPKPFVQDADGSYHLPDRIRVFAKCINGGGPFEPVDIMIMTQSL